MVLSRGKSGRTWLRFMLDQLGIHLAYSHFEEGIPPDWTGLRIILLHRDPRDVLVSKWFASRFRTGGGPDTSLAELLEDPDRGLTAIADFNLHWAERIGEAKGALILSYEAMLADPAAVLRRVLGWLGVERSDDKIARSVEASTIERMREMEASGEGARRYGFALAPGDPARPESFKTRRGGSGGWREHFTPEQALLAERLLAERDYEARMAAAGRRFA